MDVARDHDMTNTIANVTHEFYVGRQFNNTKCIRRVVKIYSVKAYHTFMVAYSNAKYEEYRCPECRDVTTEQGRAMRSEVDS